MILDSDAQKTLLVKLLGQVPVQTTLAEAIKGPQGELRELLEAVDNAEVKEHDD